MIVIKVMPDRLELRGLLFKRTIFKNDITSIDLAGRESIGLLSANRPTSAIVIRWGRSDKIVLADGFYRNMPEIKQALHEHFLSSSATAAVFPEDVTGAGPVPEGAEATAVTFAGQPLLNIHTILFLVYLIMIAIALGPVRSNAGSAVYAIILVLVFLPMYVMVGARLYYFKVSGEYLIIKNHFFPWYTKGYKLKDVSAIVVEISVRRVIGLRVNTHGFFSKRYPAGSLRRDGWKGLQQVLEDRGIPVKNELPG